MRQIFEKFGSNGQTWQNFLRQKAILSGNLNYYVSEMEERSINLTSTKTRLKRVIALTGPILRKT